MSQRQLFSRVLFASILFTSITPLFGMEKVHFDVNNNNNVPPKDKEEADEEVDVNDIENEIEHPVILDGYENARVFHARLMREHPEWFRDNVQSYYKRIDPITSRPLAGRGGWYPHNVSIGGRPIMPNEQSAYIHNGISFNPNDCIPDFWQNFDPNNDFTLPISYIDKPDTKPDNVRFKQNSQKKVPVLTRIEDYNACVASAEGNQFFLRHKITFKGMMHNTEGEPHIILIEVVNGQQEDIILQGMELIFNKDIKTTQILFDFVDTAHEPVDLMHPIECRHSNEVADNSVFCIKEHKVYNCAGKAIHSFFDSPTTRERWVTQGSLFYDQNNRGLVALPSRYADPNDQQERATDPLAWVLGEGNNSLYQLQELELKNTNSYICCDNNLFYALLFYQSVWRDYLSPVPNNRVRFDYLLQVKKPSLRIANVGIEMGHHNRASGLYKSVRINNITRWQPVNEVEDVIEFGNAVRLESLSPTEPYNAQEIIQWGDAGQRFFGSFHVPIPHCNQALLNKLGTWSKVNHLNLSQVKLANDIASDRLFTAIGTMRQLIQLDFSYNHPIANIQDGECHASSIEAHNYYVNLGTCLGKLTNLKKLYIQGLWLKPHSQLGLGCLDEKFVSLKAATLLRINNRSRNGISYLVAIIRSLAQLESLSIDAIPNRGVSDWEMIPQGIKVILFPITLIMHFSEDNQESIALQQLVIDSADRLAQKPSLHTISVYSPGGNCVNYFSKAFRDRLAATRATARAANPNLLPLTINAEVLK